jgi:solute carrier family 34 (sodium-dependent phosphate cotransporter)
MKEAEPLSQPHQGSLGRSLARAGIVVTLLFFFLVAIQLMSGAFDLLGRDFARTLVEATKSPFVALFIGIISTALVQSSSVTTSMVVGLVSAGALPVEAAVPIIMGANVGTSVTNLIVSLGHMGHRAEFRRAFAGAMMHDIFNWMAVVILLPIELMTGALRHSAEFLAGHLYGGDGVSYDNPISILIKPVSGAIVSFLRETLGFGDVAAGIFALIISLLLIFTCLGGLVRVLRALLSARLESLVHRALSKGLFVTMGIGIVATVAVQSSSITTSILVPLIATGLIRLDHAFPITLGANIGTTITALLASLAGNQLGLAIALVHLLFNTVGILIVYPIPWIRRIPIVLAQKLGDIAAERRSFAVLLVVSVFFVLPLVVILIERALH